MLAGSTAQPFPIGTYANGLPYIPARGRYAPRQALEDRWEGLRPVFDLLGQRPTAAQFLLGVVRQMQTRYYQPSTVRTYRQALAKFLRWFGAAPHRVTRDHVRAYLELLVRGGGGHSWVGQNLLAIRVAFDKLAGRSITLGLVAPRKPKRLPVILSTAEVIRLLESAPSLRDKLLLGLLYGTGVRSSELVRLRWRDLDFEKHSVTVWEGLGRGSREVILPASLAPLLREQAKLFGPDDYLFPGERSGTHLSIRSVARAMDRAMKIAGIGKLACPRSLRHSFAVHLLQSGINVRYVQSLLGHAKLETTTLYAKLVFRHEEPEARSPLDVISGKAAATPAPHEPVGRMRMELTARPGDPQAADVKLWITGADRLIQLDGIVVREVRPGWVALEVPHLERWEQSLCWLTPQQRQRIESADFYRLLREHASRRFLAGRSGAG